MRRPSHYLLLSFAVFAALLWWTGKLEFGSEIASAHGASVVPPAPARLPRPFKAVLNGRILDAQGWPVAGAAVRRQAASAVPAGADASAESDRDGRFQLRLEGNEPVDLLVEAPSFRTLRHRVFPAAGDPLTLSLEPAAPWDEELADPGVESLPAGSLAGEGFVKSPDGHPVADALVTVAETGFCARTSDIGRYTVALPDGPATLVVHAPDGGPDGRGWAALSAPVRLPRKEGLAPLPELVVAPGTTVRGTVRDPSGNPLAGAPLLLRGRGLLRYLETDPSGAFSVAGLLTGSYELLALAYRGSLGLRRDLELGPAGFDEDLLLVEDPPRRLHVLDPRNHAFPGVHVAVAAGGRRRAVARSDEEGWVDLRGLGDGEAEIEVRGEDVERSLAVVSADLEAGVLVVEAP